MVMWISVNECVLAEQIRGRLRNYYSLLKELMSEWSLEIVFCVACKVRETGPYL